MEFILKDNVVFNAFTDEKELKGAILKFIYDAKTDKILYKGDPTQINYKLLKKILPLEKIKHSQNKNSINTFIEIDVDKNIRDVYQDFLTKIDADYCLIYKS